MSHYEIGTRVFAVQSASETHVKLFGFGVYEGDELPPHRQGEPPAEDIAAIMEIIAEHDANGGQDVLDLIEYGLTHGSLTQEQADESRIKAKEVHEREIQRPIADRALELFKEFNSNPKITLDTGVTVWGGQCWWGPESEWEKFRAGREIEYVNVTLDAGV